MKSVWEVYDAVFKKYFPRLRKSQKEILEMYENVRDQYSVIEIEAPPGVGKSLINMIIALSEDTNWRNVYNKIVIASFTKQLQYQYVESFEKPLEDANIPYAIGLGARNFVCKLTNKKTDVCIAALGYKCRYMPLLQEGTFYELLKLYQQDPDIVFAGFWLPYAITNKDLKIKAIGSNAMCDFWVNEYLVHSSKVIFANYHYLFSHLFGSKLLPIPSVLVLDEAHKIPEILSDMFTVRFNDRLLEILASNNILRDVREFVKHRDDYNGLAELIDYLYSMLDLLESVRTSLKGLNRLLISDLITSIELYKIAKDYAESKGWSLSKIFDISFSEKFIVITPTYFFSLAILDYLSSLVKYKVILSSATLPPYKPKELTPGEIRLSSIADMYPPEQRPVIFLDPSIRITNTTIAKKEVQNLILNIIRIFWKFRNFRRIVIHSINNFIRDYLGTILQKHGFPVVITDDLVKDIDKWSKMKEGIIISAGMEEGVDLKYDLARVQIIVKLPLYDFKKDAFARSLVRSDKMLYNYYIARRLVQMAGRICRARDDFGVTIILDKRAFEHYKKYLTLYPLYFRKAVKVMSLAQLEYNAYLWNTLVEKLKKIQGMPIRDIHNVLSKIWESLDSLLVKKSKDLARRKYQSGP